LVTQVKIRKKVKKNIPLSNGILLVNQELCCGCMHCIFACSLTKEGTASPELARIQLPAHTLYIFDNIAQPCLQCVEPQCLRHCPAKAIMIDETSGTNARIINEDKCTGCRKCIENCPYTPSRISFDKEKEKAIKCDLCSGDPQCIDACPTGALKYYTNPDGVISGYTGIGGI
jgi:protein NrfC